MDNKRDIQEAVRKSSVNGLKDVVGLANEFCNVLTEMERVGICIDLKELDRLEEQTKDRIEILGGRLDSMAQEVMGDTIINLGSPEQLSSLLFSRRVINKARWASECGFVANQNKFERFAAIRNISERNFVRIVNAYTKVMYRTEASICSLCNGIGKIQKKVGKKDGGSYLRKCNCPVCGKTGVEYKETPKIAGFRITPRKKYMSSLGFQASNDVIEELLEEGNLSVKAKEFVTLLNEYRKLNSYLSSAIQGIKKNVVKNILHTNFNQCTTSTNRLSSTNPNVQNFPRGDTFPIGRVFVSRWSDGIVCVSDMGQLEFRVAAFLSGSKKAKEEIIHGVDIHSHTANALGISRQEAKAYTFRPLYGGKDWGLMKIYPELQAWHGRLIDEAVRTKCLILPSGRRYYFPNVKRTESGCTEQTKIKNYPVQGFASADIVPAILVELYNKLKSYKSCLVSTIHDSVIVDIHPEEYEEVIKIVAVVMNKGNEIIRDRYGINMDVPLVSDIKVGNNAYDAKEIQINA